MKHETDSAQSLAPQGQRARTGTSFMVPLRIALRRDLVETMKKLEATHGLTITRLVNSSLMVGLKGYSDEIILDAKGVNAPWLSIKD